MTYFKSLNLSIFVILLALSLFACTGESQSQNQDQAEHANHMKPAAQTEVSASDMDIPKEQVQKILKAYLQVKDALVQTNGETASQAATQLVEALGNEEDELLKKIRFDAEHIAETQDPAHQRDHFNTLSDNVYAITKATQANESTLYRQYCPMAFNNKGAYRLASEKEVNNPYFGDKMLHCGKVEDEL